MSVTSRCFWTTTVETRSDINWENMRKRSGEVRTRPTRIISMASSLSMQRLVYARTIPTIVSYQCDETSDLSRAWW